MVFGLAVVCKGVAIPQSLAPNRMFLHPFHEGSVFLASLGQNGDEFAFVSRNIGHVLLRTQLAVGYVDEVCSAHQLSQNIPRVSMRRIIGDVSVIQLAVYWHSAIAANDQVKNDLLQVRSVILIEALSLANC
jgi:hypothetical protein